MAIQGYRPLAMGTKVALWVFVHVLVAGELGGQGRGDAMLSPAHAAWPDLSP